MLDRLASRQFKLSELQRFGTREEAADYLEDFWSGWIANPMLNPVADGAWAQLTLACLAVEASSYWWRPISRWKGQLFDGTKLWKNSHELRSGAAFGFMFCRMFPGDAPNTMSVEELASITYRVFRCGLAHRGLSKSNAWLGVIEGASRVFRDLSHGNHHVLSVDPHRFAQQVDSWFAAEIVSTLRTGGSKDVDDAFKGWCDDRWEVPTTNWSF